VFVELVKLIQSSRVSTEAIHSVSRHNFLGESVRWLLKEINKAVLRFLTDKENMNYVL